MAATWPRHLEHFAAPMTRAPEVAGRWHLGYLLSQCLTKNGGFTSKNMDWNKQPVGGINIGIYNQYLKRGGLVQKWDKYG